MKPLELTLEFTRSSREPFRLGEQAYLQRKETGRFQEASLNWGEALLSDLAELGTPRPSLATVRRLGELLRGFLEQVGWESYETRIQEALRARQPVFLSLQFDADELYALPWELLTLGSSGQRLAELPGVLLRYEWPDTRTVPLDPDPPKGGRILYAWSSAGGLVPSERQGQALRQACAQGGVAFEPQRDVLEHASARQLATALNSPEPVAILHLLCHGAQRGPNSLGLMLDATQPGGEPEFIDGQSLASILAPHARTLRLVVLSACQSGATGAPGSPLPGVARALHQAGIQCVVASRLPLSVEGAVEMTETLYGELLGNPCSLEQALVMARDRLRSTPTRLDWASLQLYARAVDGTDTRPLALRPYRGLLAFQPEHSRFFFGREPLQEELLNRVDESLLTRRLQEVMTHRRHQFQVVAGASGSGKSSLVLAGVVAHLDRRTWDVWVTRPGEACGFAAAKSSAHGPGREPERGSGSSLASGGALLKLWTALHQQWAPREVGSPGAAIGLAEVLEEAARMRQARPDRRLLLVVDQFEEVFTQLPSLAERQAYVGALWALAERGDLGVIVLSTLRVDYFSRCGELTVDSTGKRLDAVVYSDEHRMFVTQLQGEQLQAIIEGPARKVGLRLDEGLVEVLRRDVGAEPGALPLLEYALDQLWERRVGNRLTHQAYEEIGGVGGALTGAANRLLASFSPEESRVARHLLVELVDFSDDASPNTRRRGWLAQLRPSGGTEQELFDGVLARLVGARLLVKGGEGSSSSDEGIWVEVAHESLIRRWETLTEWVRADRKAAHERRELRKLAEKWKAHLDAPDKGRSFLLVGYRLEAARHLQREYGGQLAQDLHQFINESWRRARYRRRVVRLQIASLLTVSVVVSLVMSVLMKMAQDGQAGEQNQTRVAQAQAQIAHDLARIMVARRKLKTDPTTSLLFLQDVEKPESAPSWVSDVRNVLDEQVSRAVLKGHKDEILWVDFSSNGKWVATGSHDGTARIWDINGRDISEKLVPGGMSHDKPVVQVAFSPDDRWLVASTEDGMAHVYPMEGQARPKPFQEKTLRVVAFSSSKVDPQVITVSEDDKVTLWRGLQNPENLPNHGLSKIKQATFAKDGKHVLMVSQHRVKVWQVGEWMNPILSTHRKAVITSAALSPDNTHIVVMVSTPSGNQAQVLRVKDKELRWSKCHETVTRAEFSPDGKRVLIVSEDLVAKVRQLDKEHFCGDIVSKHTSDIHRATFSPDGNWVLTASNDGTSQLNPVPGGARFPSQVLRGHRMGVNWAAFDRDSTLVVTGAKDMTARIWAIRKEQPLSVELPHPDDVWAVAVSPVNAQHIASASSDGLVRIWSPLWNKPMELKGHERMVRAAAFSPDGQWLVTAGMDKRLLLWSISDLKDPGVSPPMKATYESRKEDVVHRAVAFTPKDERRVATGGSDGTVYFWRLEGSGAETTLQEESFHLTGKHDGTIRSIAFSTEGDLLITGSEDKLAKVWEVSTGEVKQILQQHSDWVRSVAISPDGALALTASQDGTALVWNLQEKVPRVIHTAPHEGPVRSAAFRPDGKQFATAAADGLVRVWSLETKGEKMLKPILVLSGHDDEVTSVVYMDEKRLVTSSIDHTVRLWNKIELELLDNLREQLSAATTACLGAEEWALHSRGEFPQSSKERYEACMKKLSTEQEPTLRVSTKEGE
jgi:WD40 repeat protein